MSNNTMPTFDDLTPILRSLENDIPQLNGVALISADGRVLSHYWHGDLDPDKIGAIGAALLGLGKKAIEILSRGDFLQVILQSSEGMLGIYGAGEKAVMIVNVTKECNLGLLNLYAHQLAEKITPTIDQLL